MPALSTPDPMPARHPDAGRLSPWADAATDTPGWQITTRSRRLAVAVATTVPGGTVRSDTKGQWQARLPQPVLMVTLIAADNGTLWCRLDTQPDSAVYALTFSPWSAATVLKCPLTALPALGRLSVRDVRVTTRMGRTVRFLIPAFTTP
ncbi:MAG TPA: hypothetical protein VIY52_26285 [Streptosporangiaceae bacterium]